MYSYCLILCSLGLRSGQVISLMSILLTSYFVLKTTSPLMKYPIHPLPTIALCILIGCYMPAGRVAAQHQSQTHTFFDPQLTYKPYKPQPADKVISREHYKEKLYGFWLGICIANWTGLVTEMDKIGNIGDIKTGAFYTRNDWGKPDSPSIWGREFQAIFPPPLILF
jgi:hypothetical protein